MPISLKAVFTYSATAAAAGAWTLTASTSIAAGDAIVVAAKYRASASSSLSAVFDNAGNTWTPIGAIASGSDAADAWIGIVSSSTSSYRVTLATPGSRTLSERAAIMLVLSGVHAATPKDPGTVRTSLFLNTASFSVSTSLSTAVDNELLLGIVGGFGTGVTTAASATASANAPWSVQAIATAGRSKLAVFSRTATASSSVYQFTGRVAGTNTYEWLMIVAGLRPSTGESSLSGAGTVTFTPLASLAGGANVSGSPAFALAPVGMLGGRASVSGAAVLGFAASGAAGGDAGADGAATFGLVSSGTVRGDAGVEGAATFDLVPAGTVRGDAGVEGAATFDLALSGAMRGDAGCVASTTFGMALSGTISGAPSIAASAVLAFGLAGTLVGTTASGSLVQGPASVLGGGWDARLFRRALEERRLALLRRTRAFGETAGAGSTTVKGAPEIRTAIDRLANRITTFSVAPARQAWRLREQAVALTAIEQRLAILVEAIAAEMREREAEEMILLAA